MPRIIVTHAVRDVTEWLSFHDERVEMMKSFGLSGDVVDFVAPGGSNMVAFTAEVENPPVPGTLVA